MTGDQRDLCRAFAPPLPLRILSWYLSLPPYPPLDRLFPCHAYLKLGSPDRFSKGEEPRSGNETRMGESGMGVHAINYQQVCSLHSRNYLCSLNSLCMDRKVPSAYDMCLPLAVVLLTDPGLSHVADNRKTIQAR